MSLDDVLIGLEEELTPKPPHDSPPGPLFHYTDAAGFHGIFRAKAVWATDFRYLNDTEEIRIGERQFREVATEVAASATSERQRIFLERCVGHHDDASVSRTMPPCVASLSVEGDLLSQWRAYAAGGAGYSVGFASFPLPTCAVEKARGALWLIRCGYDVAAFRAAVREVLVSLAIRYEATASAHASDREADGRIRGLFVALALRHAAALVPRLKHHAFREEQEWRLMLFPRLGQQGLMEYRPSATGLIPYVPVAVAQEGDRLDVTRVYVGPTQARDQGVAAAQAFLRDLGYDPTIVVPSEIPFRG